MLTIDIPYALEILAYRGVDLDVERAINDVLAPADDTYTNDGESPLSDEQYDAIKQIVQNHSPEHPYFSAVGSNVRGGKIALPFQMGSLDQVQIGDLAKWIHQLGLKPTDKLVISAKLDGTSGALIYNSTRGLQIAYSRGNGFEGADITRHLKHIAPATIPATGQRALAIRGENIIAKDVFASHVQPNFLRSGKEQYRNPRNAVAGLMNASVNDPGVYQHIDFVAYQQLSKNETQDKSAQFKQLESLGFKVPWYDVVNVGDLTEEYLESVIEELRDAYEYEIDGVVVEVDSHVHRARLDDGDLNPRWAMKYKTVSNDNYAVTEVVSVEWNASKTRYGKPRVILKPVNLPGIVWTYATGYNAKWIVDNGIGPGAIVGGSRMGDVTPNITTVIKSVAPQLPPDGTYEWNETGVDIIMVDKESERDTLIRMLTETMKSLGVVGLRDGVSEKLVDEIQPTDFNELFSFVIGWGEPQWSATIGSNGIKIHKSITDMLASVTLGNWLGSMPHFGRGVGKRKMNALLDGLNIDTLDAFYALSTKQMESVEKFQSKTAEKIKDGMQSHKEMFASLQRKPIFKQEATNPDVEQTLAGQKVVMTGFRNADMEKQIEQLGGKIQSAVSKATTIVVAASTSGSSSKIKKVKDLIALGHNIKLLDIKAFTAKYLTNNKQQEQRGLIEF